MPRHEGDGRRGGICRQVKGQCKVGQGNAICVVWGCFIIWCELDGIFHEKEGLFFSLVWQTSNTPDHLTNGRGHTRTHTHIYTITFVMRKEGRKMDARDLAELQGSSLCQPCHKQLGSSFALGADLP